jgi:hypothetical protein
MRYQRSDFLKTVGIQQEMDPFPGGQFAFFVLGINTGRATAQPGFSQFVIQNIQLFVHSSILGYTERWQM